MTDNHNGQLVRGRLLARNIVWNLVGSGPPMLAAVLCIPILIRELGKERFGVLTLIWVLIGYASLFDLGLGRALTQLVAQKLGKGEDRKIPPLVWTSLALMTLLGLVGTAVTLIISPWLSGRGLNIPVALQGETVQSFRLLGLSLPFVITTAGLRGLLEAHQRFALINALRIPMGVFTFAGPLLALLFSKSLVPVVAILLAGRLIGWVAHLVMCIRVAPELRGSIELQRATLGPLLRFGGWMTVTNVISPLMVTLDRFLIGTLMSIAAVAYYTTPYELVTKLWVLPSALLGVMFPAFSTSFVQDRRRTALLFSRSIKSLFLALFPIVLCTVALAQDGLRLWLGADFAQHGYRVVQILVLGVFINSLSQVPFALLQGLGRPDLTARLHLIELPVYVGLLWSLIKIYGIEGAAIAWTIRVIIDGLLLFALTRRFMPGNNEVRLRTVLLSTLALLTLLLAALLKDPFARVFFVVGVMFCFALVTWFRILTPEEKTFAQSYR